MKLLFILLLALSGLGCSQYGYHPHYIISQDEEQSIETPVR